MPDSTRKLVDDALGGKYKVVELLGAPARFQASYKARPTGKRGGGTSVVSITSDSHSRWTFGSKQVYEMGARKADFRHVLRYSELKSIEGPGSQSYTISIRPYLPRTLSESTSTGLPKTRAWRALEDVLKGLIELHRNGLVHGDLTPSNVFFDRVWTIGDFGRSKDSSLLSEADQPFVAPELRAGEPASAAADIYSFGQLAHSLLSFDDPGVSSSVELSAAQLRWILECCQRRSAEDRPSADALYNLMFDRPALIRVARRSVRDATPWTGSPTTSGRRSRELREAANRDRTAVRHAMADLSHAPQLALFLQTPAAARRYTALLDRALVFATPSADDGNRDPVAVMEAESKSYSSSGIDDEWVRQIERAYRRDFKSGTAVDPEEVSRMMSRFAHTFRIANEVRGELLASCPMYYTHEVARLLSDQEMDVTEADILNLSQTPRLLVVRDHGRFLYPTFQFAEARIRPVVGEVNEILGTTGHEWSTISWWYSPHGMFADYPRPVDHVVESEQVLAAARFSVR